MPAKLIDLVGQKFGRLTVISRVEGNKNRQTYWNCICECGNKKIIDRHNLKNSNTKSCGCYAKEVSRERCKKMIKRIGAKHPRWKGGRNKTNGGYIQIRKLGHPNADKNGYLLEHVYNLSEYLDRPLRKDECVHHINGIKTDNRIENLELLTKVSHFKGQRVEDIIKNEIKHLEQYGYKITK